MHYSRVHSAQDVRDPHTGNTNRHVLPHRCTQRAPLLLAKIKVAAGPRQCAGLTPCRPGTPPLHQTRKALQPLPPRAWPGMSTASFITASLNRRAAQACTSNTRPAMHPGSARKACCCSRQHANSPPPTGGVPQAGWCCPHPAPVRRPYREALMLSLPPLILCP